MHTRGQAPGQAPGSCLGRFWRLATKYSNFGILVDLSTGYKADCLRACIGLMMSLGGVMCTLYIPGSPF